MATANYLETLTDGLADLSSSEIRVLESVALSQREKNPARTGLLKFWTSVFLLLSGERKRRVQLVQEMEMDFHGLGVPVVEWTGNPDPENSVDLKVFFPKNINGGDAGGSDKDE